MLSFKVPSETSSCFRDVVNLSSKAVCHPRILGKMVSLVTSYTEMWECTELSPGVSFSGTSVYVLVRAMSHVYPLVKRGDMKLSDLGKSMLQ